MTDIQRALSALDWNFSESASRNGIHSIHGYPARFIPEIPRALIRLFHPGDRSPVLDPFCGSGTTLVEAAAVGLPAYGVDLNPLAALITKVKTTPITTPLAPAARDAVRQARSAAAPIPDIPRLDHWFQKDVQDVLARLTRQIDRAPDPHVRDALRVSLSRIIIRVSRQESDTRYAAIPKDVDAKSVYSLFVDSAETVGSALAKAYGGLFGQSPDCRVLNHDVLTLKPSALPEKVGLVVTSPPYPNAYEYWLYHKYRMYWLGLDPLAVREREIGARPHFFKKNHHTETDFQRQMGDVFSLLARIMKSGALACFLVGDSRIHGRHVDNGQLLKRGAAPHGFREVGVAYRSIPSHRKSFNLAHARIKEERIAVFQLEGSNS